MKRIYDSPQRVVQLHRLVFWYDGTGKTDKLTNILHQCDEWKCQTALPLAQSRIELDLDDGVKVNYQKLGEALAPIPGLAAKEEE
jgi:hypothetical protein